MTQINSFFFVRQVNEFPFISFHFIVFSLQVNGYENLKVKQQLNEKITFTYSK
jgi:hypothetical protein